jgi:hypothetical protein
LVLGLLAVIAPVAADAARTVDRSTYVREGKQALARRDYRALEVHCHVTKSGGSCGWHGSRHAARCAGSIAIDRRGHRPDTVSVRHTRCTRRSLARGTTAAARSKPTSATSGASPPATTASAPRIPLQLGFNTYTSDRTIAEQQEVGATVSRLFVDWAAVEPSQGQWDWQQSDQQYQALIAAGLKPLIVAFTAPCWARPSTDCSNPYFTGPPDAGYDSDWSDYVRQLAARYPGAAGIEVWNEPNLDQYFLPRSNPARFTQLLSEAYSAVKSVNPNMPVISGGLLLSPKLPGSGIVPGGYGAVQFLQAIYADGASKSMDALGVHIYPSDYENGSPAKWDPNAMKTWLSDIEPVRTAAAADEPIWVTEMGVSTGTEPGWPAAATPTEQASDLSQMVATAQANPQIRVAIIQGLEDQTAGDSDPDNSINSGWGIFTSTGVPKAAACTLTLGFLGKSIC